jgi:hypothetical protein
LFDPQVHHILDHQEVVVAGEQPHEPVQQPFIPAFLEQGLQEAVHCLGLQLRAKLVHLHTLQPLLDPQSKRAQIVHCVHPIQRLITFEENPHVLRVKREGEFLGVPYFQCLRDG